MGLEVEIRVMLRDIVREVVREEMGSTRPKTELENELLTYEQASELVSVHQSTIKRWVGSGVLPAVGKGKLRRVRAHDVRKCFEGDAESAEPELKQNVTNILASLPGRGR